MHEGALSDGADLAAREPASQPGRGGRAERLGQLAALGARLAVQAGAWVWKVQRSRQRRRGLTESAAPESELGGAAGVRGCLLSSIYLSIYSRERARPSTHRPRRPGC